MRNTPEEDGLLERERERERERRNLGVSVLEGNLGVSAFGGKFGDALCAGKFQLVLVFSFFKKKKKSATYARGGKKLCL